MAEDFDPYHKWLGIPPCEQPPNHYRLLGIGPFESDDDIIDSAADQRMAFLKTYQNGKNGRVSQELLTEISKARVCLLNKSKKSAYDSILKKELASSISNTPVQPPPPPAKLNSQGVLPPDPPQVLSNPPNLPNIETSSKPPITITATGVDKDLAYTPSHRKISQRNKILGIAIACVTFLILAIGGYAYFGSGSDSNKNSRADESTATETNNANLNQPSQSEHNLTNETEEIDQQPPENQNDSHSEKAKVTTSESDNEAFEKKPKPNNESDKNETPALILENQPDPKPSKGITRGPVPESNRWKPFVDIVRTDFGITDDLNRQQRFILFNELLSFAETEQRPGHAFAMYKAAIEQATSLSHSNGIDRFDAAINKRFTAPNAKLDYALAVSKGVDDESKLAIWLEVMVDLVNDRSRKKDFVCAVALLTEVVRISQLPVGRTIDGPLFRSWLSAAKHLSEIQTEFNDGLSQKASKKTLTGDEHRRVGTYYCFVNGDWQRGLDHYRQTEFKPLVSLAKEANKDNTDDAKVLEAIAEKWYSVSSKVGPAEFLFRNRALHFFERLQNQLPEDKLSKKTLKRLEELGFADGLKSSSSARKYSSVRFSTRATDFEPNTNMLEKIAVDFVANDVIVISGTDGFEAFFTSSPLVVNSNFSKSKTPHPIATFKAADNTPLFATFQTTRGIRVTDVELLRNTKANSRFQRQFRDRAARAFSVGEDGFVYTLAATDIHRWTPKIAWENSRPGNFETFTVRTDFIPKRIDALPNSEFTLSDSRHLVRVLQSKKTVELHSGEALFDHAFPPAGNAVAMATKGHIRIRAFKGSKRQTIQTQPNASKLRFLNGSRFLISLHKDYSLRLWDLSSKESDYQMDALQIAEFNPVGFAISPNGKRLALIDGEAKVKFVDLVFN